MSVNEEDLVRKIRLKDVRVILPNISKSVNLSKVNPPPAARKRRTSSMASPTPGPPAARTPASGSKTRKITNFFQYISDSDKMDRGNSSGSDGTTPARSSTSRVRLKRSDNKENHARTQNSAKEPRVAHHVGDQDVPIDDFLPAVDGSKVEVLSSPQLMEEVHNRYNLDDPEENRNELIKVEENKNRLPADEGNISENFKEIFKRSSIKRVGSVSPFKERTNSTRRDKLRAIRISPVTGKTYRRSSLMSKLLDASSDTEEESDRVRTPVKPSKSKAKNNEIKTESAEKTDVDIARSEEIIIEKVVEKSKKRVHFDLDYEDIVEVESETETNEPVEPVKPVEPVESVEPAEPAEPAEPVLTGGFELLAVVWARIGGHPWWPGLISIDPDLSVLTRMKQRQGGKQITEINVSFFGENSRAFVDEKNLRLFEGLEEFEKFKSEMLKGKTNKKLLKTFSPSGSLGEKWQRSVEGAEIVRNLPAEQRIEKMMEFNREISAKKKRKLSVETVKTDTVIQPPAKRLNTEVQESGDESGRRGRGATRRQQDVKLRQEEREKKEKEKGPGWYYELVPVKPSVEPELQKLGQFVSGRCCLSCEETGGQVWRCRGCFGHFHPQCQGVETSGQAESFRCLQCQTGEHLCQVCHQVREEEDTRRCSVSGCGKYYHPSCLSRYTIWPQARISNGNIYCPDHTCHSCASDNPKDPVMKYNEKLMHCLRCPTAYHAGDHCVAAGTIQITKTDIICPKHYTMTTVVKSAKSKKSSSTSHVNTNWCFICSKGGSLLCCDKCPASFHEECLGLTEPLQDKYFCEDCQSGRLPLYNDIVWAKWGAFRWWPALVLHPSNVPDNIEKVKHQDGEFPIKFLGSGDYNWINHGRTFFYEEGDSQKVPSLSNSKSMDATFKRGLAEAEELYRKLKEERLVRERQNCMSTVGSKIKGGNKPQYIKIKNNKPFGNCPTYSVDPEICQPCDCDKGKDREKPCGEDSNCMNRMLMFECLPSVCPVKDKCLNMRFQKRQYPSLECFRTVEGRGWGLRSSQTIKKGQFVIEYVGELITMEEYRNRMAADQLAGQENYYYLTIDSNRMIDAGPKGNLARFMNHSCDPNCITQKWTVNGDTRVGLFAIKDVAPGTELTFNYQFETVGDNKKKCMCGAGNCSGLIGEKPQNKEKAEKKVGKMLKNIKKKKQKKKKSSKAPWQMPRQPETVNPGRQVARPRQEKVLEEICFRCGEGGNLIYCDSARCPKAYHLLCVGLDVKPAGLWLCPWHHCAHCSAPAQLWCRHCPTAVCAEHSDTISLHPVLGSVCAHHSADDLQLLVKLVEEHGLAAKLPCPSPSQDQLRAWRSAWGVKEVAPSLAADTARKRRLSLQPRQRSMMTKTKSRHSLSGVPSLGKGTVPGDKFLTRLDNVLREEEEVQSVRCSVKGCEDTKQMTLTDFSQHYALHHADAKLEEIRVMRMDTGRVCGVTEIYQHVLQCSFKDCNLLFFGTRSESREEVVHKLETHWNAKSGQDGKSHHDISGEGCSYKVLVEDGVVTKTRLDSQNNQKMTNYDISNISVAVFDPSSGNVSFSKKGYEGPYHCLSEGCDFVLTEFGLSTQKKLVNHWLTAHQDIKTMLYYDQHSHSVLNLKVILNNVGVCNFEGCGAVLFSSRRTDFASNVNTHWRKVHPTVDIQETNMVNIVSTIPQITADQAVSLVKRLPIHSEKSITVSNIEKHIEESEQMEDDEEETTEASYFDDRDEESGPYNCSLCDYQQEVNVKSSRAVLDHWINSHDRNPETLRFVDVPTGRSLSLGHFFKTVGRCRAENCDHILGNNGRDAALFRRIRKHWADHHSHLPLTPDTEKLSLFDVGTEAEEPRREDPPQLRCSQCDVVLTLTAGSSQTVFQHWAKHSHHPSTLQMVRTKDEMVLNIRQLYTWIYRCLAARCSFMAVSNVSAREAEGRVREHWARSHNTACPARCEELTHLGYQCCLCPHVLFDQADFRDHLATSHPDQELDQSSLYLTDLETGDRVLLDSTQPLSPLSSQPPTEVYTTVLQCPAVSKGGKQCPELAMDTASLMTHWGSQHVTNGAEFRPLQRSILEVTHYQCPVRSCSFRHLSCHSVRRHWEAAHKDHTDKFTVIKNTLGAGLGLQGTSGKKRENISSDSSQAAAAKKKKLSITPILTQTEDLDKDFAIS